ncbi:MAG: ERCC4 domain-containing protein [Candidatus Hermodarchaeota archaeon]
MNQANTLRIIIDNRERKLMTLLESKFPNIIFESKQLDIADIVISEDVAIERKEGFDFVASIVDNRLFEQLMRLKETYTTPILILEGLNDNVFENTGMKIASIYGALAKIAYKLEFAVIPTRNLDDTAIVIERIAYREQVKDGATILSRKAPKSMSIDERRSFIVEGFVDIGPKKAKSLIEKYETPYQVFKAIKHTEIKYTRTGNPKGIEGPLNELSGFGWKFVEKNKEMLFGKTKQKGPVQKRIDEV